ncbi:ribosomal RNA small subunit methyltransferase G [Bacilli bacterium]|nr:ribosomal RNA small subunit methyltransferase G [Bacilli bacterium]
MNVTQFRQEMNKTFSDIDATFFDNVEKYKRFLQEYNQKINLTRLDSDGKIYGDYFYESVIPFKNVGLKSIKTLLDIGSGSGIPGIVLKLMYPHITLTIIESNNKKVTFLNKLCGILDIKVNILYQRAELIEKNQRESFDLVTSRAVAPLPILVELSIPYLKVNGILIEPKTLNAVHEINVAATKIEMLGSTIESINDFVSVNKVNHKVVVIKKNKITDLNYPRT